MVGFVVVGFVVVDVDTLGIGFFTVVGGLDPVEAPPLLTSKEPPFAGMDFTGLLT